MATIESIQSFVIDLPPSCIEYCPFDPSLFVIGTYQLQKKDDGAAGSETGGGASEPTGQSRDGSLLLYGLNEKRM